MDSESKVMAAGGNYFSIDLSMWGKNMGFLGKQLSRDIIYLWITKCNLE